MQSEFDLITEDILNHPLFIETKNLMHHGNGNTVYEHSLATAITAYSISKKLGLSDELVISTTRAALLHDFFGYDWHEDWFKNYLSQYSGWQRFKRTHAFIHGDIAAERAKEHFNLSERQLKAIKSHMFPVCFSVPTNCEAWIITLSDKIVATREISQTVASYILSVYKKVLVSK